MADSSKTLQRVRRMGSMEQIFTVLQHLNTTNGWGSACIMGKIAGLSKVSTHRLQLIADRLYRKYQSLQTQILTVKSLNEYDWLYTGCSSFKIIRYNKADNQNAHYLYTKELNHRHLVLDDYNITEKDILSGNYDTNKIPPLYRVIICNDDLIFNIHHALGDGLSLKAMVKDFLILLNNDAFDNEPIQHTAIESCVAPKYASSPLVNKLTNYVPSWFMFRFIKTYSNNRFLARYNPLSSLIHQDDILRFKHMFFHKNKSHIAFPLNLPYNKYDWKVDYELFILDRMTSAAVLKQCKLNKSKMSALLTYITNAAVIESHRHILQKEYYKTVVGNIFSTIPMYHNPNKTYVGMHASSYNTVIPYHRNVRINSDKFWKIIEKIGALELTEDKVVQLYKNKFPVFNFKRFVKYTWDDMMGEKSMGPPTISNPGRFDINKDHFKHKLVRVHVGSNPAIGWGAPYYLGACSVKHIDELTISFVYGTQFFSKETAQEIVDRIKQKLEIIAASYTNYQSKL